MEINDFINIDFEVEKAKKSHIEFIKYTWQKSTPFIIGHHTKVICDKIDKAIEGYKQGKNQFLIIQVPFRHGKSDIISRYLPPHFLGMFPGNEVVVSSYSADLSHLFSRFARDLIDSKEYKKVYPNIELNKSSKSVSEWSIKQKDKNGKYKKGTGETQWVGTGGGLTGRGYHLGIVDDYLKNREEAESETIRKKCWEWFKDVFMTRRAPVSITIILATPWHTDDLIGRIKKETKKDPKFPKFEITTIPAESDKYPTGYLFPERFPVIWYEGQKATLGTYGTASLLQCNPILRGGNMLKTDKIKIIEESELPPNLKFSRGWDLASSKKERVKDDPDFTVGVLASIQWRKNKETNIRVPHIYIKDIERLREEAPKRNRVIIQTTKMDGGSVKVGVETVAGYKDAYTILKEVLMGVALVRNINVSSDKVSRASALEPIFEAGHIYLVRGDWNKKFISEAGSFPSGKHDDQIDGLIVCYEMQKAGPVSTETVSTQTTEVTENRAVDISERKEERGQFQSHDRKSLI
jgi:predicted phage terminase large subunit-like protein